MIWDAAYKAEYNGLINMQTWELLSEDKYQALKKRGKGIAITKTTVE